MFPITSRYFGLEIVQWTAPDGRLLPYVRRRFLPTTVVTPIAEHVVVQGDRLDNVTAQYLGDPEQFWRVADANDALHPDELTQTVGRRLIMPLIQGGNR